MKKKYKILISLLILFLSASILINLHQLKEKQILINNKNENKEESYSRNKVILNLENKIKDIENKHRHMEDNINKINSNIDNYNEILTKLQNQTEEGKNNNIKTIINLLEIRDHIIIGKNFSEILNTLENMTKNNNELHTAIMKIYDYKNDSITNNEIIKSFSTELNSVRTINKNEKNIKNFIKSNIRLTKSNNNNNLVLLTDQFKEFINRNEYKEALDLLNLNKNTNNFENTTKLLSRKLELTLLVKEAFDIIYKQN